MTWVGQRCYCDNCRTIISGSEIDPICDSEAYAPDESTGFDLCEPCYNDEQAEQDRIGSNEMPERVTRYRRHRMSLS